MVNKIGLRALALSSLLVLALASSALAASSIDYNPFTSGLIGADVSWPNCTATYPTASFGIVGVTGGRAFTANSCFGSEWAWAKSNTGVQALYLNLNAPIGSTSSYGTAGPETCKRNDKLCLSYNYGWQAAQWAYQQATSARASASTWWLDVETGNSWSSSTAANDQVIQGAVDYLGAGTVIAAGQNLTVGVYSTKAMYAQIAGAFHPTNGTSKPNYVPTWYATATTTPTAAAAYCTASNGFTGGPVWLVQYLPGGVDADYAC